MCLFCPSFFSYLKIRETPISLHFKSWIFHDVHDSSRILQQRIHPQLYLDFPVACCYHHVYCEILIFTTIDEHWDETFTTWVTEPYVYSSQTCRGSVHSHVHSSRHLTTCRQSSSCVRCENRNCGHFFILLRLYKPIVSDCTANER